MTAEANAAVERSDRVIARVLSKAEHVRGALVVSGLVSFFLVATVIDDYANLHLVPLRPSSATYAIVVLTLLVGALGQWIVRPARPKRADVRCRENGLVVDGKRIEDVRGVSVARAAHGLSVAIAHGKDMTFVEVEREEDAARIASSLPRGDVPFAPRSRSIATLVRVLFTSLTLAATVAYYGGIEGWQPAWASKATGVIGVVAIVLSFFVLAAQAMRKRRMIGVARGAWDAHVTLHQNDAMEIASQREPEGAAAALARGDEPIDAWLSRVRSIPANEGAYRGDAMKRDVLWDKLADDHAPPDVRMAAARVLRIRYEEDGEKLRAAVSDRDVRKRVAAAIEDDDDVAADRIESLGPLFRAR
jgi:hypothetical protein